MSSEPPVQSVQLDDSAESWRGELAGAFEALLGRRLDEFDPSAAYVLYHWDDMMSAEFFEFFEDADVLGAVVAPEAEDFEADDYPLSWTRWQLDLGRSLFLLEGNVSAGARAVSLDESRLVVNGADLARLLDGEDVAPDDVFVTVLARVATDATLFDAMRAATWTMGSPADLADFRTDAETEPKWAAALERIDHPALRDHLRMLCLTAQSARSAGGLYLGTDHCPADLLWPAEQPGHTLVAAWEFGEGQASSAIFEVKR